MNLPKSPSLYYYQLRNQSFNYIETDSEERQRLNVKSHPDRQDYWLRTIEYRFNSQGFRGPEWTSPGGCMALGCSYTLGIGVREEETFADIVSKRLGLECYNLGQGGGSLDTVFYLASTYLPVLKPRLIIVCKPNNLRFDLIKNSGRILQLTPYTITNNHDLKPFQNYYITWCGSLSRNLLEQKNTLALLQLAAEYGSKIIIKTSVDLDNCAAQFLPGRDNSHPGPGAHLAFAELLLNDIDPAALF